ncbi:MAG: hypothetical protein ACETWG_08190, partial [Candidatus Neomarinimicrobiota bacterium]
MIETQVQSLNIKKQEEGFTMKYLVKASAIALLAFFVSTAYGLNSKTLIPTQVPKGAYANGSDGNQVFVQTIEIQFAGHTPAAADFLQVDIPADLSIADINNDGNYDDEVSLNWNTFNAPAFAVDAAQTDANIIVIDVGAAAQLIQANEKLI